MPECCAPNCTNTPEEGYRMFMFPQAYKRRKLWVRMCCNEPNWKPTLYSRICEVHFDEHQWFKPNSNTKFLTLKPLAYPTLFNVPDLPGTLISSANKRKLNGIFNDHTYSLPGLCTPFKVMGSKCTGIVDLTDDSETVLRPPQKKIKLLVEDGELEGSFMDCVLSDAEEEICVIPGAKIDQNVLNEALTQSNDINYTRINESENVTEEVCIVCAKQTTSGKNNSICDYVEMISDLTGINILSCVKCPIMACDECFQKLVAIWNFKLKIINTVNTIHEMESKSHCKSLDVELPFASETESTSVLEYQQENTNNTESKVEHTVESEVNINPSKFGIAFLPIKNIHNNHEVAVNTKSVETPKVICEYANFNSNMNLNLEQAHIKDVDELMCNTCGEEHLNSELLQEHKKRHESNNTLCCYACTKEFENKESLQSHLLEHLGLDSNYKCPYCDRIFSLKEFLMKHIRQHQTKDE